MATELSAGEALDDPDITMTHAPGEAPQSNVRVMGVENIRCTRNATTTGPPGAGVRTRRIGCAHEATPV